MPGQDFPGQCLASVRLIKSSSVRVWCQLLVDTVFIQHLLVKHIENITMVNYYALNEAHHISGLGIFKSEKHLMFS